MDGFLDKKHCVKKNLFWHLFKMCSQYISFSDHIIQPGIILITRENKLRLSKIMGICSSLLIFAYVMSILCLFIASYIQNICCWHLCSFSCSLAYRLKLTGHCMAKFLFGCAPLFSV